ncbi:ABC transporter permease [Umezawaea endophytica]|uniref:ABC transporter permease n=1 Tax=Umezawaea endophytica TaxID=1654476 RepID=A0A9X3AGL3_9PSEU|nr:ABC transporter permease [Umezawaea endophytica]MCS7480257.1 ABC transporter permease [Umezawaea endophytica]
MTVGRPSMGVRDLLDEAVAGITARPVRTGLTMLGTVIGITTLVITLGVAATAADQIAGRFDAVTATEVTVVIPTLPDPALPGPVAWTALPDLVRLNGVRAAAAVARPDSSANARVRTNDLHDPTSVTDRILPVVGTTTGLPDVLGASMATGRYFDDGHVARHDRVAVLGGGAAKLLGVVTVDDGPAVFVDGQAFTVIGVLGPVTGGLDKGLSSSVLLPHTTGDDRLRLGPPTTVLIRTDLGAAPLIAEQAPIALSPNGHAALRVLAPPDPATLRGGVQHDVNGLFVVLGLVSLVVGAIGIANVTLVTVVERTGEIGLRRALGAARRHVAYQFLAESVVVGLIGGVLGASTGVVSVVAISISREWTPVLDLPIVAGAPVAGALVGLLAGLYPALRAARMQPVDALRSGT